MTYLEETIVGPADITTLEDPAEKSEERRRRLLVPHLVLNCLYPPRLVLHSPHSPASIPLLVLVSLPT